MFLNKAADKPDAFGLEWLVRFTVTPAVPIPWAK